MLSFIAINVYFLQYMLSRSNFSGFQFLFFKQHLVISRLMLFSGTMPWRVWHHWAVIYNAFTDIVLTRVQKCEYMFFNITSMLRIPLVWTLFNEDIYYHFLLFSHRRQLCMRIKNIKLHIKSIIPLYYTSSFA